MSFFSDYSSVSKGLFVSLCGLLFFFFANAPIEALEYVSSAEVGAGLHSGLSTSSMNGALSGFLSLRAQRAKGFLRFQNATEFGGSVGTAFLGASAVSATLFEGSYSLGGFIYPLPTAILNPFLGLGLVLGWGQLRLRSAPSGADPNTDGIFYGYELSAGCDIRAGKQDQYLRLRTSLWNASGALGGQTNFQLGAFRVLLGFVF